MRLKRSRAYLDAEHRLSFAALCVIGPHHRQRRRWDDNEGAMPTRLVVTSGDPANASRDYNRGVHSPDQIYHTLAYAYWQSREHAERVKDWLEERLKPDPMLHGWWNMEAWQWEIMVGEAAKELRFNSWDESAKVEAVAREAARRRRA